MNTIKKVCAAFMAAVFLCLPVGNGGTIIVRGPTGAGSPAPAAFSDNFNRSNASTLGAEWTTRAGQWGTFDNQAENQTGSVSTAIATYNTGSNTITTYQRVTLVNIASVRRPGLVFRFTDASSAFYVIELGGDNSTVAWKHFTAIGGTESTIASTSQSVSLGDVWGITITGTGDDTVVRCWLNPTATSPVSASEWDTGDTTPEVTFTANPASPVNSGTFGGLYAVSNAEMLLDNWHYGDATP